MASFNIVDNSSYNTPSNRHFGRGEYGTPEGEVNTSAYYDEVNTTTNYNTSRSVRTTYPPPHKPSTLNITMHDNVFRHKNARYDLNSSSHRLQVMSVINGMGVEAAEMFPGDIEMQKLAVKNQIQPMKAIATDYKEYSSSEDIQGLSLQTLGKKYRMTNYDISPGEYIELDLPDPRKIEKGEYISKPGDEVDAYKLEVKPYRPSSLGSTVLTHFVNQLKNSQNYRKAMDPKFRSTDMWLNAGESMFNFTTLSGIMFLYRMMKSKALNASINPNGPFNMGPGLFDQNDPEKMILVLARAFGLVNSASKIQGVAPLNNVKLTSYRNLKREILFSVITDGSVKNLLFGYANGKNPGIGPQNRIMDDTPHGQLITQQINAFNMAVSGLADAYQNSLDWVDGLCVDGATKGRIMPSVS